MRLTRQRAPAPPLTGDTDDGASPELPDFITKPRKSE
jgi:hypothetical protein